MNTIAQDLAEFATNLGWDDIPESVAYHVKLMLMDHVGCALGAHTTERGKSSISVAQRLGGISESSVIGTDEQVSCANAAFANAELMITLDYSQIVAMGHDGTYLIPTTLAMAESTGSSGKELISATAVSHEISARLGRALGKHAITSDAVRERRERGPSDPTGNAYSNFGAAAGAGRCLDLDIDEMADALGIAGHMTQTLHYSRWSYTDKAYKAKYGTPGWQQTGAIKAALLAETGYAGDLSILDDPEHGFTYITGFDHWNPSNITTDLAEDWIFNIRMHFKPYPCCGYFHSALDCFYTLLETHELEPEEIDHVTAYLQSEWGDFPSEGIAGKQFDPGFAFAAAAHRVPRGPQWYAPATMNDPSIQQFGEKVSTTAYPGYQDALEEEPVCAPGKVEIEARGQKFSEERRYRRGTTGSDHMLTDNELAAKFRRNADPVLSDEQIDAAIDMFLNLETLDDVSALMQEVTK